MSAPVLLHQNGLPQGGDLKATCFVEGSPALAPLRSSTTACVSMLAVERRLPAFRLRHSY